MLHFLVSYPKLPTLSYVIMTLSLHILIWRGFLADFHHGPLGLYIWEVYNRQFYFVMFCLFLYDFVIVTSKYRAKGTGILLIPLL